MQNYIRRLKQIDVDDYYGPLIRALEENPDRPLAKFIKLHPSSILPKLYSQMPDSGLLEFLEEDIHHPFLLEIEKDPKKINDLASMSDVVKKAMTKSRDRLFAKLSSDGDMITNAFKNDNVYIHEDMYAQEFHPYFSGKLSEEEGLKRFAAWITISKSINVPVHIVNDAGETLFIHPGLGANCMTKKQNYSWNNFATNSKRNNKRQPGATERYQDDFLSRVFNIQEEEYGKTNFDELRKLYEIYVYFEKKVRGETPNTISMGTSKPTITVEKEESDWDIF